MSAQAHEQADQTAQRVLMLWAAYRAGQIQFPEFTGQASALIYTGKLLASRLADIEVSMFANMPPVGITPGSGHLERLSEAVETILSDQDPTEEPYDPSGTVSEPLEGTPAQLERLASAETLLSHRRSLHAAIREQGYREWVRIVEDGACEICAPHAGRIYSIEEAFTDHPGCRCTLEPHGERSKPPEATQTTEREEPAPLIRITREVVRR